LAAHAVATVTIAMHVLAVTRLGSGWWLATALPE
jgi:hypothetical protein